MKERLGELKEYFNSYSQKLTNKLQKEIINYLSDPNIPIWFKTKAILFLRKHKKEVDNELLSEALSLSHKSIKDVLINDLITVYFPAAYENKSQLFKMYVIKLNSDEVFSFKENLKDSLNTFKNLFNKGFFVLFEDDFSGNSFMLALVGALIAKSKSVLDKYAFTGAIDYIGNVIKVEQLDLKQQISSEFSKKLIYDEIVKNIHELDYVLNEEKVDIPFCIALKPSTKAKTPKGAAFHNLYAIKMKIEKRLNIRFELIEKLYGLNNDDLVFYITSMSLPNSNWKTYIEEAYMKIKKLKAKVDDKISVVHFSFLSPTSFVFCLGTLFGSKEPFIVYQYNSGDFKPVLDYRDRNTRFLKEIPKEVKYIECSYEGREKEKRLAMIFYLASHQLLGDVKRYIENIDNQCGIVYCSLKDKQGNLPLEDWTDYVREMYKHYNNTKIQKVEKRMFFFSCPLSLAFGFGIDIETSENADIFNFGDNNSYFKIFNLRDVIA